MAMGPPPHIDPRDPFPRDVAEPKRARNWIVKDNLGERLEIRADQIERSREHLTLSLEGQVIACINGWNWYRLIPEKKPTNLDAVKPTA
jgi:hypothetical protein